VNLLSGNDLLVDYLAIVALYSEGGA